MTSLRARVNAAVLAVIVIVIIPLGIWSYRKSVQEFAELGDARLVQATRTIDVLAEDAGLRDPQPKAALDVLVWRSPFTQPTVTAGGHRYEALLGFQYWNAQDQLRITSDNFQGVPMEAAALGFADMILQGQRWRVFTLHENDGDTIRVAERYDSRNGIARDLLIEHATPLLVALPVLALLVGWAVRRALRPLDALSRELTARAPEAAAPIEVVSPPRELHPVIAALNGLLARVREMLERERQLTADAAHQLRTPLAAALLHLENAAAAESADLRELALSRAHEGLRRLNRLVEQFLELARWESAEHEVARELIDLEACVRTEVEEAGVVAADKDLEVSVVAQAPNLRVSGWEPALRALVRNLIDNAFRYTPSGGRVEVRLGAHEGGLLLEIADSGPGIPASEREMVFKRFRRGRVADTDGSGLGLPIVGHIAELHGARVDLRESHFGGGLCVAVLFPAQHTELGSDVCAGERS